MKALDWIALDWGTSVLRVWAMSSGGEVLASASSESGMSVLDPVDYEPALLELIDPWLSASGQCCKIIGCGMVGSKQGWIETPYRAVPCTPLGELVSAPVSDQRIEVFLCPGMMQESPADVMRGEETQIAGWLAAQPEFEGVVCLPGTHSKWARVGRGEIRSFQTFLTGELFALLARESVLRHSVARDGWDESAFLEAVDAALATPDSVSAQLFSIRAESMLHQWDGVGARSCLSGYLIGWELAATRGHWLGREVVIVGEIKLAAAYGKALEVHGATPKIHSAETMTLAGLQVAYDNLTNP